MARVLVLGSNGQLGWELVRELRDLPAADGGAHGVIALDYPDIDLADEAETRGTVQEAARGANPGGRPGLDVVVNAAAYTAVDKAEREPELARAINARAPEVLADEARKIGAAFIHYSTDYVFDGTKGEPYQEADEPNPLGVYGATKLEGERAVLRTGGACLILRTAWVYSMRGDNFVTKVLRWASENETLKVVGDQVSNPTWARDLARATVKIVETASRSTAAWRDWFQEKAGLYHIAGDGYASRLEWAREILSARAACGKPAGLRVREIAEARTADFPTPARRPLFSALDCEKFERTFGFRLAPWRVALKAALSE